MPIVDSIVNDNKRLYQVNVPSNGAIDGLPDDVVVEVPAFINGKGVRHTHVGRLPTRLMLYVIIPRMLRMEWALGAFLEGGKQWLLEWLQNDPRTKSTKQAEAAIKDILALPFNKQMAKHYK